ncbi:MAG: exonuclease domain-containing protein, partial [Prochloraceae cyanobacterium]
MNEETLNFLNDEKYLAHLWAYNLFKNSNDWIVLDTETTGLNYKDEFIDIAIVSRYGSVFFDSLIKPTCDISEGAAMIHG